MENMEKDIPNKKQTSRYKHQINIKKQDTNILSKKQTSRYNNQN
jgi:hypothetical protein